MTQSPKIIIVGSGIIGASIALACQDLNADILVLEQGTSGGVASGNSFGWINASFAESPAYYGLRLEAIEGFRNLGLRLDLKDSLRWQGTLWWEGAGADFDAQWTKMLLNGYAAKLLNKNEVLALEPNLADAPEKAILTHKEGAASAQETAKSILRHVSLNGGKLIELCTVTGVRSRYGRLCGVKTDIGDFDCDMLVLATGAQAQSGLDGLDWSLPMANKAGMVLQTNRLPQFLNHTLMTSDVHFRQNANGSLTAGEIFGGDFNPVANPNTLATQTLERIQAQLKNVETMTLVDVKVGQRPVPKDGFPVIGALNELDGLFTAVMHSGVTLGPFVGELLAAQMLLGSKSALLADFSPARFEV
ncbi:MAG: FAD-binding oxidoreductase [Planktomarina sp.]|nr:FAD-binding oxidoreductase [Planktomarina sp.]